MKLRDKLKISFCVMIVLPVIMLCVFSKCSQTAYARHIMLKVIRCYYIFIRL